MTNIQTSRSLKSALAEARERYGRLSDEEKEAIRREHERQQAAEYAAINERIRLSKITKAGLLGNYATAECPLGRELATQALDGKGTFLWGKCGRGKTYAASCAVKVFILAGKTAKLMSTTQYLGRLKATFDDKTLSAEAERKQAAGYDLLVLDDMGIEQRTEWSVSELEYLIDERYKAMKPTIITSNYSLGALRDLYGGIEGERIASRIAGCCTRREVKGKDWRLA